MRQLTLASDGGVLLHHTPILAAAGYVIAQSRCTLHQGVRMVRTEQPALAEALALLDGLRRARLEYKGGVRLHILVDCLDLVRAICGSDSAAVDYHLRTHESTNSAMWEREIHAIREFLREGDFLRWQPRMSAAPMRAAHRLVDAQLERAVKELSRNPNTLRAAALV